MSSKKNPVDEFLTDPEFVRWVQHPDRELDMFWIQWMEANPDKKEDLKLAREIIQGFCFTEKLPAKSEKQTLLVNILNQDSNVGKPGVPRPVLTGSRGGSFWDRVGHFSRVAAVLFLAITLSFLVNYLMHPIKPVEAVADVQMLSKRTAYGEKLNFKLPDGTSVWLNSGSKVQYPAQFDSLARKVVLEGEAFFEVVEDPKRPFSVVSEHLTTQALGTSFNINEEKGKGLSISLVTGKVKVQNELTEENILLLPGQQLHYSGETGKTFVKTFEKDHVVGWISGTLLFSEASLEEVTEKLEKWYGVKIRVSGEPPRKWTLSGEYRNQDLVTVLERISYIERFEFSLNEKSVHIKF